MLKRGFDFCLALAGLVIFFPFMVFIYLFILISEGRPVFYRKRSIGKGGKEFDAIKFRSMAVGSLRITRFGKILRQAAMDELPQLINILKGEMSFVGPRNYGVDKYNALTSPDFLRRLEVTPGLTGLAQIFAPKYASNEKVLEWDIKYIKNRNFILDLKVIFISIRITLFGRWERKDKK